MSGLYLWHKLLFSLLFRDCLNAEAFKVAFVFKTEKKKEKKAPPVKPLCFFPPSRRSLFAPTNSSVGIREQV